jgi:hypothetical protein
MKKKHLWAIGIILLVIILLFIFLMPKGGGFEVLENFEGEITVYKSPSCGCCGLYADYFKGKGNKRVEVVNMQDISSVKKEYGVPSGLESCHITVVGNYFVEGHIPLEAIDKLLSEKPDIAGIAMPDMPSGSPGMPGRKYGDFVIYAVEHDGSYSEFMRI